MNGYRVTAVGTKNKPWVLTKEDATRLAMVMDQEGRVLRMFQVGGRVDLTTAGVLAAMDRLRKATGKDYTLCVAETHPVLVRTAAALVAALDSSHHIRTLRPELSARISKLTRTVAPEERSVDDKIATMVSKLEEVRIWYKKGMPVEGVYYAFVEVMDQMLQMVVKTLVAAAERGALDPVVTRPTKGVATRAEQARQGAVKPSSDPRERKTPRTRATTAGNKGRVKGDTPTRTKAPTGRGGGKTLPRRTP